MRDFRLPSQSNVNSVLLGYYVADSGNFLHMFWDNTPKRRYETTPTRCVITQKNAVLKIFVVQLILLG
jgi:hypothetical protein